MEFASNAWYVHGFCPHCVLRQCNLAQVHLHLMQSCSSEFGTQCNLAQVHEALTNIMCSKSLLVDFMSCDRLLVTLVTLEFVSEVGWCGTLRCQKYAERHGTFVSVRHPPLAQLCCISALWPQPNPRTSSSGSFNFQYNSGIELQFRFQLFNNKF